jgi:hypothetical protein
LGAETAWEPTPAQQEAALRLAKSEVGLVRTHDDGATELRTIENGGLRRYIIAQNGEVALVESGASFPGFAWSDRLGAAGMLLCFGSVGFGVFVGAVVAVIVFLTGFATFIAHLVIWEKTFERAARTQGEPWSRIGGPDH